MGRRACDRQPARGLAQARARVLAQPRPHRRAAPVVVEGARQRVPAPLQRAGAGGAPADARRSAAGARLGHAPHRIAPPPPPSPRPPSLPPLPALLPPHLPPSPLPSDGARRLPLRDSPPARPPRAALPHVPRLRLAGLHRPPHAALGASAAGGGARDGAPPPVAAAEPPAHPRPVQGARRVGDDPRRPRRLALRPRPRDGGAAEGAHQPRGVAQEEHQDVDPDERVRQELQRLPAREDPQEAKGVRRLGQRALGRGAHRDASRTHRARPPRCTPTPPLLTHTPLLLPLLRRRRSSSGASTAPTASPPRSPRRYRSSTSRASR